METQAIRKLVESSSDKELDPILYEIWREEQRKRSWRFIAIPAIGGGGNRLSVTEITFPTENGIAINMKGATQVLPEPLPSFPKREQAEAEAKIVFEDYLRQGWLEVIHG